MNTLILLSPFIFASLINIIATYIQITSRRKFLREMQEFNAKIAEFEKLRSDIEKY